MAANICHFTTVALTLRYTAMPTLQWEFTQKVSKNKADILYILDSIYNINENIPGKYARMYSNDKHTLKSLILIIFITP